MGTILSPNIDFNLFEGLEFLPFFSPGHDEENSKLTELRQQISKADGVIFCTPEYAFGVPGVLKNALDCLVGTGELNDKPIIAISASPLNSGGDKALASLLLTLTALGTQKTEKSYLPISNVKQKLNGDGQIIDDNLQSDLQLLTNHFLEQINKKASL